MIDTERIKKAVREILIAIGEDPDRPGLRDTPRRVADMYCEILAGYEAEEHLTTFKVKSELVIVGPIRFFSLCEHHLLPFYGYCWVAYLPRGQVLGLSKIVRIVQKYARRLQIQERMTEEIANAIAQAAGTDSVMVVLTAKHMCMMMRGVRDEYATATTSTIRGLFLGNPFLKQEVLRLMRIGEQV